MNRNVDNSILERTIHSDQTFATSTDVNQWRQDVDAFTVATRQMLGSIHQNLSNGLAQGRAQGKIVTGLRPKTASPKTPTPRETPNHATTDYHDLTNEAADSVAAESEQILARLKAQLAEQLNQ